MITPPKKKTDGWVGGEQITEGVGGGICYQSISVEVPHLTQI